MKKTTYTIEVTQGVSGPIIDRFTIDINDDLDADERYSLIQKQAYRRLNDTQSLEHDND
jgi:hypothetical protein